MKKAVTFLVAIIGIGFLGGCSVKKTIELTDAERFANEYSINTKNPFIYATIDEVLDLLENKSGIIFFGDSDCEWCVVSASILSDVSVDQKLDTVYYYNPTKIEAKNTKKYRELVSVLRKHLGLEEAEEFTLSLPEVYFVKKGKVIAHKDGTSITEIDSDKKTSKSKEKLKQEYLNLIKDYRKKEGADDC